MDVSDFLNELRRQGIELTAEGDRLTVRAPRGTLTPAYRASLAERKPELLALLRRKGHHTAPPAMVPDRAGRYEPFPLTDVQQAYWVGRSSAMSLGNVACYGYREFEGVGLDVARLEQVWRLLVARHEMLRAVVLPDGQQRVLEQVPPYQIQVQDLRGQDAPAVTTALTKVRERMSHQVLPADRWPLFDIRATLLDDNRVRVHFGFDLLIADAASLYALFREWAGLYNDPAAVRPPPELSFRDCVLAERAGRGSERYRQAEDYWFRRLTTLPSAPTLPLRQPAAPLERPHFSRRTFRLDSERWRRLKERAAQAGLTPSGLVAAVYAEVLATWSKDAHFCITLTFFNRPAAAPALHEIVGDFTSTLLLEVDDSPSTFAERARRLQSQLAHDLDHSAVSGVRVLRELNRRNSGAAMAGIPVVFTSVLGHRSAGGEAESPTAWLGETTFCVTQTPQVWLDHHAVEENGALVCCWDAQDGLFQDGLLDDMFAAQGELLRRLAEDEAYWQAPERSLAPMRQLERRAQVNATAAPLTTETLHGLFLASARRQPDALAVIAPQRTLTYRELDELSGAWAARLRSLGAGVEKPVAVVLEKGWEQVVAALGVLRAGAAYVPLDPSWPTERLHDVMGQCGATLALTTGALDERLDWPAGVQRLRFAWTGDEPELAPSTRNVNEGSAQGLAYVIFTSGSTGKPKGVAVEHRAAVNTVLDINERFGIGPGDRVLALSALTFDLSVYDLFGVLAAGGALVLPAADRLRDPAHWLERMTGARVTLWNTVPALMEMLVAHLAGRPEAWPATLRLALLSGDWIPVALPGQIAALSATTKVISLGGATEAAVWSIYYPIERVEPEWTSIPYGWPLRNQTWAVLDERLEPRPDGVAGQLYIGGAGLARGYWGDDALTAARFILHPRTGERLYATGDLGRYRPDGALEFLGRTDQQVKVQGHRIELGEIEAALQQHPAVRAAVAASDASRRRLVAYVVPQRHVAFSANGQPHEAGVTGALTDAAERLQFKLKQPGLRARTGEPVVALNADPEESVLPAYRQRRSQRRFAQEPVTLAQLGRLLACMRPVSLEDSVLPKYRYPSAGDLYPVQTYVYVKPGGVEGLASGTYYYYPRDHVLVALAPTAVLDRDIHAAHNQPVFDGSAFSLFFVGQLDAIAPLYGDRARDFCLLEAGYLGQLLMTEAPTYDIGLCPIGGLDFDRVRPWLALDAGHVPLHSMLGGRIDSVETEAPPAPTLAAELRQWLETKLPDYMVPSAFVVLDALPLSPNGKIDRQALPAAEHSVRVAPAAGHVPPQTELEQRLAGLLCEALHLKEVSIHDNFFDLGATSLHLVQVHRRIVETLGREVAVVDLFRHPTIHALAGHLLAAASTDILAQSRARAEVRRAARERRRQRAPEERNERGDERE